MQGVLRSELTAETPGGESIYRPAYSHGGFLTWKGNYPTDVWSAGVPRHAMTRASGHIIESFRVETGEASADALLDRVLPALLATEADVVHVWQPDEALPGQHGYRPGESALAAEIRNQLSGKLHQLQSPLADRINSSAQPDQRVVDLIIEQPHRWWLGTHRVVEIADRWPGGVPPLNIPPAVVSRAYYKAAEAHAWTEWHFRPSQRVCEIGSSPGGSCQYWLECGLAVTGVDPAEPEPVVMQHPRYRHLRGRAKEIKKGQMARCDYLAIDANVSPNYTLDVAEELIGHRLSRMIGVLLTLKLKDAAAASRLPEYLDRVRTWGFSRVAARQLAHNRREITVVADGRGASS